MNPESIQIQLSHERCECDVCGNEQISVTKEWLYIWELDKNNPFSFTWSRELLKEREIKCENCGSLIKQTEI